MTILFFFLIKKLLRFVRASKSCYKTGKSYIETGKLIGCSSYHRMKQSLLQNETPFRGAKRPQGLKRGIFVLRIYVYFAWEVVIGNRGVNRRPVESPILPTTPDDHIKKWRQN